MDTVKPETARQAAEARAFVRYLFCILKAAMGLTDA